MNKLAIIGHPTSSYQLIEEVFQSYGMQKAKPSRRENFLPAEINKIICQSHGVKIPELMDADGEVKQLEVGNVWHGLALDLMLGNLETSIWGWADHQAIFLLNFWRDLDPEIIFVLTYSKPEDILLNSDVSQVNTSEALNNTINQWITYNEAIVSFYNRNKERCFLINSNQAKKSSSHYLLEISNRLNAPWLNNISQIAELNINSDENNNTNRSNQLSTDYSIDESPREFKAEDSLIIANTVKPLSFFLSKFIINQHPKLKEVYEDLESLSNFPADDEKSEFKEQFTQSAFDAWIQMHNQEKELQKLKDYLLTLEQDNHKKLSLEPNMEQENAILLNQLHHVQEELERYYLENKALKEHKETKNSTYLGYTSDQIKMQLAYRLGQVMINQSKTFVGFLLMPVRLLNESSQYKKNKAQGNKFTKSHLSDYEQHQVQAVKKHLSYQLGSLLINCGKNPIKWLFLPFNLFKTIKQFKANKRTY